MRSALIATLASVAAMGAYAHPHTRGSASLSKRAIDLDKFRMVVKTEYKNATAVDADPTIPSLRARATPEETANELVAAQAPDAEFRLSGDHYTSKNGVTHLYFKQTANGLDIDNADFNVNVCLSTYLKTKAKLTFGRLARTAKSSLSATLSSRARFRTIPCDRPNCHTLHGTNALDGSSWVLSACTDSDVLLSLPIF